MVKTFSFHYKLNSIFYPKIFLSLHSCKHLVVNNKSITLSVLFISWSGVKIIHLIHRIEILNTSQIKSRNQAFRATCVAGTSELYHIPGVGTSVIWSALDHGWHMHTFETASYTGQQYTLREIVKLRGNFVFVYINNGELRIDWDLFIAKGNVRWVWSLQKRNPYWMEMRTLQFTL